MSANLEHLVATFRANCRAAYESAGIDLDNVPDELPHFDTNEAENYGAAVAWDEAAEAVEQALSTRTWTVIGYYRENRQPWATSCEATSYDLAQEAAREEMLEGIESTDVADVVVTGVIEGSHAVCGGDNEHGDI